MVVNDRSTDLTSEVAKSRGAVAQDLPFNLGIGGPTQAGYQYAYEKGYDIAIQVDGGSEFYSGFEEGWGMYWTNIEIRQFRLDLL